MPPNSFVLNQTFIFPHPLTKETQGKERNKVKNWFVLMLNFKKIQLAKTITQYLLTYLAQCLTWLLMWVYMCPPLPLLMACSSVNYCMCTFPCFPLFTFYIVYRREQELKKKKAAVGFSLEGPRPVHAELPRCNFSTALPLSGLFIPPRCAPLEKTGRWTSMWEISSSRRCRRTSHPPPPNPTPPITQHSPS